MARLIPGKTKVQIELFKGVTLADIAVGVIAFLAIVFVVISSLPYKVYIVIALLAIAALLLVRMDTQPNYIYLMHILRHFGYGRNYGRSVRDEVLVAGGEEEAQDALLSKLYIKLVVPSIGSIMKRRAALARLVSPSSPTNSASGNALPSSVKRKS